MFTRQVLKGLQTVVDNDDSLVIAAGERWIVHYRVGTTFFEGLNGKFVTIKRLTFQCKEDASLGTITAVGSDAGMLLVKFIKLLNTHNNANFGAKIRNNS